MTTATAVQDAAERFADDVADHTMTVLHDDGLYRHIRFAKPATSFYWFDLITWPGNLAVRGDMGGYLFSRDQDMFTFFRARSGWNAGTINPSYWAEKLPDCGRSVQQYSEDVFVTLVEERLAEYEDDDRAGSMSLADARALLADARADGQTSYEEGARDLLAELERGGVVSDTWEWDLRDWTYQYLWTCHAIQWGIDRYDGAPKAAVETVTVAGAVL
jgi:hypothetical protein